MEKVIWWLKKKECLLFFLSLVRGEWASECVDEILEFSCLDETEGVE
jgi:hypothetical protein